jgi:DNA-binding IclR family transcriptional regulator
MLTSTEHLITVSTRERRAHKLLRLIGELRNRSMTTYEVSQLLDCKTACAQKYLQQLRDEDVIVLDRHHATGGHSTGKAVYRLSNSLEKIREFQELIVQPKKNRSSREKLISLQAQGSILNVTVGANGQRIYMLADETHHAIRSHSEPVQRDPLVAALFGAAKPTHTGDADANTGW